MNVLQKLRKASKEREKHWNPTGNPIPIAFRFTEFAGEAGEVANAGKKLMRHDLGLVGGSPDQTNLKEELGDAIISLELIAAHYGVDLWQCVVDKFNKTSDKHGFPIKLTNDGDVAKSKDLGGIFKGKNGKAVVKNRKGEIIGLQG